MKITDIKPKNMHEYHWLLRDLVIKFVRVKTDYKNWEHLDRKEQQKILFDKLNNDDFIDNYDWLELFDLIAIDVIDNE